MLDDGGYIKALLRDDGASILREKIAIGKPAGRWEWDLARERLRSFAEDRPLFVSSLSVLADGELVPVAGGVLIKDESGDLLGAVGVTGDTSDQDEECAMEVIRSVGLVAVVD